MISSSPPTVSTTAAIAQRNAAIALLLGTVFWGCGFTWAKMGGDAIRLAAGDLPASSAFGPVFLLAWRFLLGGAAWLAFFPAARRGWTLGGLLRGAGVGVLLAAGLITQHIGLDSTSEAVSAFLTSLTILFVPLLMTFALGKPPRGALWLGVALATAGVWLMTGASPRGFGRGELLGLACALAFSLYILAVNAAAAKDTPYRVTGAQFIVTAIICFGFCAMSPAGRGHLSPPAMLHLLAPTKVWANGLLLTAFTTIAAFGLLTHFQPRLDPTRAALLYLMEPVMAVLYAAIAVGHYPGWREAIGAACILVANTGVELLTHRSSKEAKEQSPALID